MIHSLVWHIFYLKINHFSGLWRLGALTGIEHRNTVLLNLLLEVTQFAFHFIAATNLVDELALEGIDVRIQLQSETKLCKPKYTSIAVK